MEVKMKKQTKKQICAREIRANLNQIQIGGELTRPLKQLNEHCEFRKKYEKIYGKCAMGSVIRTTIKKRIIKCKVCKKIVVTRQGRQKYCKDCYRKVDRKNKLKSGKKWRENNPDKIKAYEEDNRERNKARYKIYHQKPEVKARRRAYNQRPDVKAKLKAYNQRPDIKVREKARKKKKICL